MTRRWTLLYAWALLFFLSLPAAQGAGIDLQPGLKGSWYEPQTSGQGFMVAVYSDIALASWLTYDTVAGGAERQRWYTLSGPVVSGQTQVSMTIYQNTGGNFNAPPITTALPVGTATLSFDSCTSGQLIYNFTDGSGRRSTIPLTRLTQNVTCSPTSPTSNVDVVLSGTWYDAATSGQGFTVEVNPISKVLLLAWMTYAPNGAGAGAAGQRWYTGLGGYPLGVDPSGYVPPPWGLPIPVQLYESTGGLFDEGGVAPTTTEVGSGTLTFLSCVSAKLSFNFTGGSSMGASGNITLISIGGHSSGEGCWDY